MNIGKCPSCGSPVNQVKIEQINCKNSEGISWAGLSLVCVECRAILSIQVDTDLILKNAISKLSKLKHQSIDDSS